MSQGLSVSAVPVVLKHPIQARIDEICRDPEQVAAIRDLLKSDSPASALADFAVRHGVASRELADYMLRYWANVDGAGWLGDIMAELRRGGLEACEVLLSSPLQLSSWWILGLTKEFRIRVVPIDDQLHVFMTTPELPAVIRASKFPLTALDPYFRPLLEQIRDHVSGLLLPPPAPPP